MKKASLIIGIIFVMLMVSCSTNKNKGTFSLINQADEPIVRALVTVCGQSIELRDIQPGASASGSYNVKSDSHYIVEIAFRSGKKLRNEIGYITNGMDFQHEITVTGSSVKVADSSLREG